MWRDLTAKSDSELRLPEVDGERCVHAMMEQASCRACVEGCPRQAWVIDDEMLGIDPGLCDGCGLCAPVCPQGAIEQLFSPEVIKASSGAVAFAQCEKGRVAEVDTGRMPCLHLIGVQDLLWLTNDGIRHLVTLSGDCVRCDRGGGETLGQRVEQINRLLSERGTATIAYRELGPAAWVKAVQRVTQLADKKALDRRAFFRGALEKPAERLDQVLDEIPEQFTAPGMLLPRSAPTDSLPFVPVIDPQSCSGCDACVRICPQDAILLEESEGAAEYRIEAERCSGCGVCSDVCEQRAVRVAQWGRVEVETVRLHTESCSACGVRFHTPALAHGGERLCSICRRTNHHKNLYQILN